MGASPALATPVLLLTWRRPDLTERVLARIREAAPSRLYVASDGPRHDRPDDVAAIEACRALIARAVDWPCEVVRLYQRENLGCRRGVSTAISWFFSQVEDGIILEDDCLPHADFFPYCEELLNRYRDDDRVWCISGDHFQDGQWRGDGSYYFSRYTHIWGWASWRRAWRHYDVDMQSWPAVRDQGRLQSLLADSVEVAYWTDVFDALTLRGVPDTWDYQWLYAALMHGGLTALPNRNLVLNIGIGAEGTNTTNPDWIRQQETAALMPLRHPSAVVRDATADRYAFDHHFGGAALRRARSPIRRLRRLAGGLVRRVFPGWRSP